MDLKKQLFTNNDCYKTGTKMKVKGIMLHSTGANNPYLSRYVQPDDGNLGKNIYNNHWNMSNAEATKLFGKSLNKCCHAFIGYLKDKKGIATYQVLPWNHRGWHAGSGSKGSANDGYVSVEICEDGLNDKAYAMAVLQEAKEWAAYICKEHNLDPLGKDVIIDHARGAALGLASNHGDILHWFSKWGITLDSIRKDVKAIMGKDVAVSEPETSGNTITHTVVKGDTPWSLAKKYLGDGNRYTEIMSLNGLAKAADIFAGQVLKIPSGSHSIHTVISGDTPWALAKKYLGDGNRYTEIMSLNGLAKTADIFAGQELKIPKK